MKYIQANLLLLGVVAVAVGYTMRGPGTEGAPKKAASTVEVHLPTHALGEWEYLPPKPAANQPETAGSQVDQSVSFRNRRSGQRVTAVILRGDASELCTHTPDVCYQANGFKMSEPHRVTVAVKNRPEATVLTAARFAKDSFSSYQEQTIYWAWLDEKSWKVIDDPRNHFAPGSEMHKLYVIVENSFSGAKSATGPLEQFLSDLLDASYAGLDGRAS